jgi:hypothetical protein
MSKPAVAGIVFATAMAGIIVYSTVNTSRVRVEVCMEFQGRASCKTVSGRSRENVLQTAVSSACSEITAGVTEVRACEGSTPKSVAWK